MLHLGWNGAWAHGVDADIVRAEFASQRAGEAEQGSLRHGVRDFLGPASRQNDTHHVDDGAGALALHVGSERLAQDECRMGVDRLDRQKLLDRIGFDRRNWIDSGVVDEEVEAVDLSGELCALPRESREVVQMSMRGWIAKQINGVSS